MVCNVTAIQEVADDDLSVMIGVEFVVVGISATDETGSRPE